MQARQTPRKGEHGPHQVKAGHSVGRGYELVPGHGVVAVEDTSAVQRKWG